MTLALLALDGKLLGPWVEELRSVIATLPGDGAVRLNLENLIFADAAGIELLQTAQRNGIQLAGASPLIDALLAAPHGSAVANDRTGV